MGDKVQQIGGLENMTEKSRLLSATRITKYERSTSEMVEMCYHIVHLRVPSYIHIGPGKYEHLGIQ